MIFCTAWPWTFEQPLISIDLINVLIDSLSRRSQSMIWSKSDSDNTKYRRSERTSQTVLVALHWAHCALGQQKSNPSLRSIRSPALCLLWKHRVYFSFQGRWRSWQLPPICYPSPVLCSGMSYFLIFSTTKCCFLFYPHIRFSATFCRGNFLARKI